MAFRLVLVSGCVQQAEKDPACSWVGRVVSTVGWFAMVRRVLRAGGGEVQGWTTLVGGLVSCGAGPWVGSRGLVNCENAFSGWVLCLDDF